MSKRWKYAHLITRAQYSSARRTQSRRRSPIQTVINDRTRRGLPHRWHLFKDGKGSRYIRRWIVPVPCDGACDVAAHRRRSVPGAREEAACRCLSGSARGCLLRVMWESRWRRGRRTVELHSTAFVLSSMQPVLVLTAFRFHGVQKVNESRTQ
ncbi:hypothetical protein HYPSUDRAFT_621265 [Hypholoma sublateritium FD-334 SS-4]|uniref:Uncharacterized protein n=1 Tax=Hypholoma sublateritium (strain FD-334 SS-4) TaxID=945553 RepID=A0A0D2LLI8_HYPSF|nr:hypothetical protein HYPSUDRAFT_621265 [Hypholoma sublateritium FD-334 SS-4]